jgi:hypothetical protein
MRRVLSIVTLLAIALRGSRVAGDEVNVRRLARRLGCSIEDARRVYDLARQTGFAAAHREVFGSGERTGTDG